MGKEKEKIGFDEMPKLNTCMHACMLMDYVFSFDCTSFKQGLSKGDDSFLIVFQGN